MTVADNEALCFAVPADLGGPSGGTAYNRAMLAAWTRLGRPLQEVRVPGSWPNPQPAHRRALATALTRSSVALVDGIMALTEPDAVAAAAQAGVAVHILCHSLPSAAVGLDPARGEQFAAAEEAALQSARRVICPSDWARRDLRRRYRIDNVEVVRPGTDVAAVAHGSSPPQLLCLAALTPGKNQRLVLDALSQITDLSWTAIFVGSPTVDRTYAAALHHIAERDFAPGRIEFCGVRTGHALNEIWDSTDLLVLTSLSETFGMVVTEGLARGVPAVVGSRTGAVEALLGGQTDGQTDGQEPTQLPPTTTASPDTPAVDTPGAIVDPTDGNDLAAVLRSWLTEPDRRVRWRAAAMRGRARLPTWRDAAVELGRVLDRWDSRCSGPTPLG